MSENPEDTQNDERLTSAVSSSYKVLGEFTDTSGAGVLGRNNASSGTPVGVEGAVPNTSSGFGVVSRDDAKVEGTLDVTGAASANSLSTTGGVSAGGTVSASANLTTSNDLRVTGKQDVGELGAVVWLGADDVQVADSNLRVIPYAQIQRDDFGAYDDSEYAFVAPEDGKYHVTVNLQWGSEAFSAYSDTFNLYIYLDETPEAQLKSQRGRSTSLSKTFFADESQLITARVEQFTGSSVFLDGSRQGNFMTVDKIG